MPARKPCKCGHMKGSHNISGKYKGGILQSIYPGKCRYPKCKCNKYREKGVRGIPEIKICKGAGCDKIISGNNGRPNKGGYCTSCWFRQRDKLRKKEKKNAQFH